MSIENSLKRIADALEALAPQDAVTTVATLVPKPEAPAPAPPMQDTIAAPAALTVVPTPPTEAPAPPAAMTAQELDGALVVEFHRLGDNRDPIVKAMAAFNVSSVADLAPEQYQPLLDAVRAVEA